MPGLYLMEKAFGVSEFCRPTSNRSGKRSMAEKMPLDGHFGVLCIVCVSVDFNINYFQAS